MEHKKSLHDLLNVTERSFGTQLGMATILKKYLNHMLTYEQAAQMLKDCQQRIECLSADILEINTQISELEAKS